MPKGDLYYKLGPNGPKFASSEDRKKQKTEQYNQAVMEAHAFAAAFGIPPDTAEQVLDDEKARQKFGEDRSEELRQNKKPGRNAPCPCKSGMKYKKCCGAPP